MPPGPSVELCTDDGLGLEAVLSVPDRDPVAAVTLAHPHPGYGGDMDAGLVGLLAEPLSSAGIVVLRWNFRGVGRSEGASTGGAEEWRDVVAALDHLVGLDLGVPVHLAGWSFGADVSLAVADARHAGWIGITPPLAFTGDAPAAEHDPRPTRLLVAEHDQFRPPDAARSATATWTATDVEVIASADHLLAGHSAAVAQRIVTELVPAD